MNGTPSDAANNIFFIDSSPKIQIHVLVAGQSLCDAFAVTFLPGCAAERLRMSSAACTADDIRTSITVIPCSVL